MPNCANLLAEFCHDCVVVYGKGFVTYNTHTGSLIHLTEDFQQYGSLDWISCFVFESYLGVMKSYVKSGYKPLQQIVNRVWHNNDTTVEDFQMKHTYGTELHQPFKNFMHLSSENAKACCHYKKARLASGCIINVASVADSAIQFHGNVAKVVDIFLCAGNSRKCFAVQKFKKVETFFTNPILSTKVGILLADELSESYTVIEVNEDIKKCILMPYRSKFVSIALIHAV